MKGQVQDGIFGSIREGEILRERGAGVEMTEQIQRDLEGIGRFGTWNLN